MLRLYGFSAERWQARTGVEPFTHPCYACGAPRTTSIPFVRGRMRGFVAPTCACGHECHPFCCLLDDFGK